MTGELPAERFNVPPRSINQSMMVGLVEAGELPAERFTVPLDQSTNQSIMVGLVNGRSTGTTTKYDMKRILN